MVHLPLRQAPLDEVDGLEAQRARRPRAPAGAEFRFSSAFSISGPLSGFGEGGKRATAAVTLAAAAAAACALQC